MQLQLLHFELELAEAYKRLNENVYQLAQHYFAKAQEVIPVTAMILGIPPYIEKTSSGYKSYIPVTYFGKKIAKLSPPFILVNEPEKPQIRTWWDLSTLPKLQEGDIYQESSDQFRPPIKKILVRCKQLEYSGILFEEKLQQVIDEAKKMSVQSSFSSPFLSVKASTFPQPTKKTKLGRIQAAKRKISRELVIVPLGKKEEESPLKRPGIKKEVA